MIRHLQRFRLSPAKFLRMLPQFVVLYLRSRSLLLFVTGLPLLAIAAMVSFVQYSQQSNAAQTRLSQDYATLMTNALQDRCFEDADLYFERCRQLPGDSIELTYDYANQLYEQSSEDSVHQQRALSLMQSIAPRHRAAPISKKAHEFLARYWSTDAEVSHTSTVLSLHHAACARPEDAERALKLAEYVVGLNYIDQAIEFVSPFPDDPECLLLLSQCLILQDDREAAAKTLDSAIQILETKLNADPASDAIRLRLSEALAARGRLMGSLFVLAAGLHDQAEPKYADHLIQRYIEWLNRMNATQRRAQLLQISFVLDPANSSKVSESLLATTKPLKLSTGESVSLPAVIVEFHDALTSEKRLWLLPLLMASEELQSHQTEEAIKLLRRSVALVPEHPAALNNLAYALHRFWLESQENPQDATLLEAMSLANSAIELDGKNLAYRETRGMIAFDLKDWQLAEQDLKLCIDANYQFEKLVPIMSQIRAARQAETASKS